MITRKFFHLIVPFAALSLLLAACTGTTTDMSEPSQEPAAESEPSEVPDAEPTGIPTESSTDVPQPTPTDEKPVEPAVPPSADEDSPLKMELVRTASCRVAAGANEDDLGVLLAGTSVNVLGRGVGAGWLAIEYPNDTSRVCWIQTGDVIYDGEFSELPIYGRTSGGTGDEDEPVVLPEGEEYAVLFDVLCLRGPGDGYSTVRALLTGELVIVHGRGVGKGWYVVAIPETGDNCWLPDTGIEFTGVYEDLTIFATPPKS